MSTDAGCQIQMPEAGCRMQDAETFQLITDHQSRKFEIDHF